MANEQNLIPTNRLTESERRELAIRAGKASGKARRNKALLKDCINILMEKKIIDEETGQKLTGAEALSISMFKKALEGDVKAFEALRDTSGQKPIDKIEQTSTNIVIDLSDDND